MSLVKQPTGCVRKWFLRDLEKVDRSGDSRRNDSAIHKLSLLLSLIHLGLSRKGGPYMVPKRKILLTANFCLYLICRCQTAGIGMDNTMVSVRISEMAYAFHKTVLSRHFGFVAVRSHTVRTGVH